VTYLGLGTYRCPDVPAAALMAAVGGAPLIDTAPVYARGGAQRQLSETLATHPGIRVSTKVGHMTPAQARAARNAGCLEELDAAHGHSLAAGYVAFQVRVNTRELGRDTVDLLYLHNPESTLSPGTLDRDLVQAFAVLEEAVADALIGGYGVATWTGFSSGTISVPGLLATAREAAGGHGHHLRAIQLPLSLVNLAPISQALRGEGPIAAAAAAGLEVWGSAPLHGADLLDLLNHDLAAAIRPGATGVQAALLVVASTPGVTGILAERRRLGSSADVTGQLGEADVLHR
jgi:aryl-alcohol dehydrogenase-like predicted oxidoreductase